MVLGFFSAVINGTALPLLMLFFGNLADTFILQDISSDIARNVSNQTGMDVVNCDSVFNYTLGNFTFQDATITTVLRSTEGAGFSDAECLLGADFISEVDTSVIAFVGIAIVVMIASSLQISTFQFAAERQVYKIRVRYYRAVLRQDIAWFDANPTGALVNRLSE